MLKQQIHKILQSNPDYAAVTHAIEKEILHHDVLDVLIKQGVMQRLTLIGGTSLRMCYNSIRLSEDLCFNGGHDFKPYQIDGLESEIQTYIQRKYETEVWVCKSASVLQGDTVSWKISIEKDPISPELPRQKMHIGVCAKTSYDIKKRPLINHYDVVVPTEGILVPVQSLQETLVDKLIALAYCPRRIKARDIWDVIWIKRHGIDLSTILFEQKLTAQHNQENDFRQVLFNALAKLMSEEKLHDNFNLEMSRFIPKHIKERTIDTPEYWAYVQGELHAIASELMHNGTSKNPFDMS